MTSTIVVYDCRVYVIFYSFCYYYFAFGPPCLSCIRTKSCSQKLRMYGETLDSLDSLKFTLCLNMRSESTKTKRNRNFKMNFWENITIKQFYHITTKSWKSKMTISRHGSLMIRSNLKSFARILKHVSPSM